MDSQTLETIAVLNAENERMEIDDEDEAQSETHPTQAAETLSHSKRARSSVWEEFVPVGVEADGKRRSQCIHCNKKLVSESASGTSSLKRHLGICPKKPPGSSDEPEYDHKVDARTAESKVDVVKKNLKLLYEDYVAKLRTSSSTSSLNSSATPTPQELLTESPLEDDLNYDLFELERSIQPGLDNKKTNLEMYLEDPRLELRSFSETEVLDYWKDKGQRYGDLASLACDLLSIPITTVASESAFSIGGRVISPYRNRLLPKNVQALLCTRNWLRGFAEFEGDIEDYFDEDSEATTTTSSSGMS